MSKLYQKYIDINASLDDVWDYISDLNNFCKYNPNHSTIKFLTEQEQGKGTKFVTKHIFKPIFPIPTLETICSVENWEKKEKKARITIVENPSIKLFGYRKVPFTEHILDYLIREKNEMTSFAYLIWYRGVPKWTGRYHDSVNKKVEEIMENELKEIKNFLEVKKAA